MRGNTEVRELARGAALTMGATTRFTRELPVGEGWVKLSIRVNNVVVIGTGAGVVAEGVLRVVREINLRTDKGEVICDRVPGRAISYWDRVLSGAVPLTEAVVAANGTYRALFNVWFEDPRTVKPVDTILDTRRYSSLELSITMTNAPTVDIYLERTKGPVPDNVRPVFYPQYGVLVPVDPAATTELLLERAANLTYKRLLLHGCNTRVAGIPFSGINDAVVVDAFTVDTDGPRPFENILGAVQEARNKQDYNLETALTGFLVSDFIRDGSLKSGLYSGDKSRLRVQWVNGALPGTPQVSLAYMAYRPLVP